MKAKGSYNPVTQSAGGEYEYGREDYRESRKNTAVSGGVVLVILVALAAIVWLFWDRLNASIAGVTNPIGSALSGIADAGAGLVNGAGAMINARQADAVQAVMAGATAGTPTVAEARDNLGEYYPVKTLTKTDYDTMLSNAGVIPATVARLGNVVTPNEVLSTAASAGADAANTVNTLGLNNAYWALPDVQRDLVTLGEGIGKATGVDLIQQGANFNALWNNAIKAVEWPAPIGSDIRTGVGTSPQPSNGQQNMAGVDDWNTYYAGMT